MIRPKHKNEIAILSYAWGEAQPAPIGGAGKIAMQDLHLSMPVSKASPKLFLACAKGEHFRSAVLTVRHAWASPTEFLKWRFTEVLISSYQTASDVATGVLPADRASVKFGKIEVEYSPVMPDRTPGTPVKAGWDINANKPVRCQRQLCGKLCARLTSPHSGKTAARRRSCSQQSRPAPPGK